MPERIAVSDETRSNRALSELGLEPDADAAAIRHARRLLAQKHHPDVGGDPERMTAINEAAAVALRSLDDRGLTSSDDGRSAPKLNDDWTGQTSDIASFTVEALPPEAFEGLLISAAVIGEIVDDDPPYRLEALLREPVRCWCRLEVVPDAGSSTVHLMIGTAHERDVSADLPSIERVRDVWVETLNEIDWA